MMKSFLFHGSCMTFRREKGKVAQTACMSACKHLATSLMQLLLEAEVRQLTLGALQQFNLDVRECEQFARSGPVPGFQEDTLQLAFIDLRQATGGGGSRLAVLCALLTALLAALRWSLLMYFNCEWSPQNNNNKKKQQNQTLLMIWPLKELIFQGTSHMDKSNLENIQMANTEYGHDGSEWDWSTYLADYGQPNCKYLRVNPVTALTLLEKMKDTSRKNNMFAQFRKNERDKQKLIDTVAKQLRGLISSHHS
ncbi:Exocyst complex component 6B [Myotis brandtii]|uniref:Exocyst complex component 6B n=1 Tax=Myotis brandtii TaxID=109478 RepID=S7PDY0_MYOBR|nr:Exocyst complex component 6B [Myotis brandtii]